MRYVFSILLLMILAGAVFVWMTPPVALAGKSEINTNWRNLAIKGYDPVAYFNQSKPVEGSSDFEYEWKGAKWRFSSAENMALFKADPEKYAPKYGGYCAWAVSEGSLADIDPEVWKIVDGKLYLNYNQDIQKKWELDIPGHISKADKNWPGVLK